MADASLKQKIRTLLRGGPFADAGDAVDVSDGEADDIHVVVFSRKFDGLDLQERQDLIWPHLEMNLSPDEWGQVTVIVVVSPDQAKAFI